MHLITHVLQRHEVFIFCEEEIKISLASKYLKAVFWIRKEKPQRKWLSTLWALETLHIEKAHIPKDENIRGYK